MIPGLPPAEWLVEPEVWKLDEDASALILVAGPGTDLIHEPLHSARVTNAPALTFPVEGDFALRAHVELTDVTGKWSAGILLIWQDADHWAKLCLERSHLGVPSIITVVTNDWSDDAVHWPLDRDSQWLRITRTGESFVMHSSVDGRDWNFVRVFRLGGRLSDTRAGFLAQSPWGQGCTATFSAVELIEGAPLDVRDGS